MRTVLAFLGKELAEVGRQPRLLLLMVLGPFAVMIAFGVGYRNERLVLSTMFVVPEEGLTADTVERYADELSEFVEYKGTTANIVEALAALGDGDVDAVVQLPADPAGDILAGEHARVLVIHDKLDPIQQVAIEFASRLAVNRLNAEILAAALGAGLDRSEPLAAVLDESEAVQQQLAAAVEAADEDAIRASAASLAALSTSLHGGLSLLGEIEATSGTNGETGGELTETRAALDDVAARAGRIAASAESDPEALRQEVARLDEQLDEVRSALGDVSAVEADVLVQPFEPETLTTAPQEITVVDYFAPALLVLLLQHTGLSIAALSFVRDRSLGLMEAYRVGPQTAKSVLTGKVLAFLIVGAVVAVLLTALIRVALDAPLEGSIGWLAGSLALVVLASVALGLLLSLLAPSDTQAVQYSMLFLLASLFFGGVFLDLELLELPVVAVSWVLPVTYGIRVLQDVMLRGVSPETSDVMGLVALAVASVMLAGLLLRRRLRVSG